MGVERIPIGGKTRKMLVRPAKVTKTRLVLNPAVLTGFSPKQQEFAAVLAKQANPAVLMSTRAVSTAEIVPTMEKFLNGGIVDWSADNAIEKTAAQINSPRSLWASLFYSISRDTQSPESSQAMTLFAQDLKRFSAEPSLFESPSLTEWAGKFAAGLSFLTGLYLQRDMTSVGLNGEVQAFCDTVEGQVQSLTQAYRRLGPTQTVPLLHVFDIGYRLSTPTTDSKMNASLQNVVNKHTPDRDVLSAKLKESHLAAWNRLKENWDWAGVTQVLTALPTFRSRNTLLLATLALEANFQNGAERLSRNGNLPESLDAAGVVKLLGFIWTEQDDPNGVWSGEHLAHLAAPRKYTPSTAIELLTRFGQAGKPENFSAALAEVNARLENGIVEPWILTLLALRNAGLAPDHVNELLAGLARQTGRICQILLDQAPGVVWLTPDRKLHPRDIGASLQKGYSLYTSSANPEEVEEKILKPTTKTAAPESVWVTGDQRLNLPFAGEVIIIPNEQIADSVNFIFARFQAPLNINTLFEDFDSLSAKWKTSTYNRSIIYPAQLNYQDKYMREAAKLGIESVYLEGDKVFFIFGGQIVQAQSEGRILRPAMAAYIDKQGQLHALGMDESFIATEEQLMLNNLALHLITQPLYMSGLTRTDGRDKAADRAINIAISSWNRSSSRGLSPKISLTGHNCIGVRVDGIEMPVLLGELAK